LKGRIFHIPLHQRERNINVNGKEVALSKYLHLRENLYYNEHHINVINQSINQ